MNDQIFHSLPPRPMTTDRIWRGNISPAPNCPRCASSKTKFCYYNNYSLSQPRFFCKGCRRYWTKGGSLRNVPEGGGCRKSRRSRSTKGHSSTISGSHSDNNPSLNSGSDGSELGCPDIDMAAVFAKFLNPSDHKQLQLEEVNQGFVSPDLTSFNGVIDDVFWLDDSNFSGLMTWQPVAQIQEINSSLPPAEECKNSTTLFSSDNWSYFDSTEFDEFLGF